MRSAKIQNIIQVSTDYEPEIAVAIWRFQDSRERTLKALADLPESALDWYLAVSYCCN
jgi:hypothetical protein